MQIPYVDPDSLRTLIESRAGAPNGSHYSCPIHGPERTPSLSVYTGIDGRGRWHCFGCGAGGDAIDFLTKLDGIEFKAACSLLNGETVQKGPARIASKPLKSKTRPILPAEQQNRLKDVLGALIDVLTLGPEAEPYLASHGLTIAQGMRHGLRSVTYRDSFGVRDHLLNLFPVDLLLGLGIIRETRAGNQVLSFANRLLIPWYASGVPVFAQGRLLEGDKGPKYLNTRANWPSYFAPLNPKQGGSVYVTEGAIDAIALHESGLRVVALPNASCNPEALARALVGRRESGRIESVILTMDQDEAGTRIRDKLTAALAAAGFRAPILHGKASTGSKDAASAVGGERQRLAALWADIEKADPDSKAVQTVNQLLRVFPKARVTEIIPPYPPEAPDGERH